MARQGPSLRCWSDAFALDYRRFLRGHGDRFRVRLLVELLVFHPLAPTGRSMPRVEGLRAAGINVRRRVLHDVLQRSRQHRVERLHRPGCVRPRVPRLLPRRGRRPARLLPDVRLPVGLRLPQRGRRALLHRQSARRVLRILVVPRIGGCRERSLLHGLRSRLGLRHGMLQIVRRAEASSVRRRRGPGVRSREDVPPEERLRRIEQRRNVERQQRLRIVRGAHVLLRHRKRRRRSVSVLGRDARLDLQD